MNVNLAFGLSLAIDLVFWACPTGLKLALKGTRVPVALVWQGLAHIPVLLVQHSVWAGRGMGGERVVSGAVFGAWANAPWRRRVAETTYLPLLHSTRQSPNLCLKRLYIARSKRTGQLLSSALRFSPLFIKPLERPCVASSQRGLNCSKPGGSWI